MTPLDLARQYLRIFYEDGDIAELRTLFASNLIFRGPFLECDSADAYISSLREDPPRDMTYEIIHAFENDSTACVVYRFRKGAVETEMAQIFECNGALIKKITLIFDASVLT